MGNTRRKRVLAVCRDSTSLIDLVKKKARIESTCNTLCLAVCWVSSWADSSQRLPANVFIYIYYTRLSIIEWLHSLLMLFFSLQFFLPFLFCAIGLYQERNEIKNLQQPKSFLVSEKYGVTLVLEVSGVAVSIHHHQKFSFFLILSLCVCVSLAHNCVGIDCAPL
jgi:hypothetical protein